MNKEKIILFCVGLYIGLSVYLYYILPQKIPVQFGGDGTVNRWGDKEELFIIAFILVAITLLFRFIVRHPHLITTPVRITDENRGLLVKKYANLLEWINLIVIALFFSILGVISSHVLDWPTTFHYGQWLALCLVFMIIGVVLYHYNSIKLKM